MCLTVLLQWSAEEKLEQIVGPTSYLYVSESVGGAHVIGGRGLQVFQCCACTGDYPIAIALEGEAYTM